jgi:PmbA protein
MEEIKGTLTAAEIELAVRCQEKALALGADHVRITLNKSLMELFGTLNGEIDKVSHCLDRSLTAVLYIGSRSSSFSTNRLEDCVEGDFLPKAVSAVRMMAEEPLRTLPDPARLEKNAVTGLELGLYDKDYPALSLDRRRQLALDAAIFKKGSHKGLISEEGEYSDSISDCVIINSDGLRCRHIETSFEYGVEVTVESEDGDKFSGYWWDAAPVFADLKVDSCGEEAYRRAYSQIGPKKIRSGKYTMVVDSEVASKLLNPVMSALGGSSLQQKTSFLQDSLGKKLFPEWMTVWDRPKSQGKFGSTLFDIEGVSTLETPVIENGVVKEYFLSTFYAKKLGLPPTTYDVTRPVLLPCAAPSFGPVQGSLDRDRIMELVGDGVLVTGFNGGNSNPVSGDFSFGVEGFVFREGRIVHPVREVLITGNLLKLWGSLLLAGDDSRMCKSKLIPTLAFGNVDFSA